MLYRVISIIAYTSLFFVLFLIIDSTFFTQKSTLNVENEFIDRSLNSLTGELNTPLTEEEKKMYEKIYAEQKKKLVKLSEEEKGKTQKVTTPITVEKDDVKVFISYNPEEIQGKIGTSQNPFDIFTQSQFIYKKIYFLGIEFYEKMFEVRGKFKDKSIKLFGVLTLPKSELFSVFVHEFGHYIDLYFLEGTFSGDTSDSFYSISWESTKVLKKGAKQSNFVSGYAMTNKYEDFAETFTFFVLHNKQFYSLAQKDDALLKKYLFFKDYVFPDEAFSSTDFSTEKSPKPYYRDITKIPYSYEKTLQYLEKGL